MSRMSAVDVREWLLGSEERENPHTAIDAVRGDGTAWSSGNSVRALVHGRDYFAELHERICALGPGDRFYFADWQGDPDQQLTDDPRSTLNNTLIDAVRRGGTSGGCCGAPTGTGSASAPTGTASSVRRSARPAVSACGTCGSAPAAPTTRNSS